MKILRNNAHIPGELNGLQEYVDNFTGGAGGSTVVLETQCAVVLVAVAFNVTDQTIIAGVISSSTAHPGTQKVTFTAVAAKAYQMLVIGTNGYSATLGVAAAGGTSTIDDPEVY